MARGLSAPLAARPGTRPPARPGARRRPAPTRVFRRAAALVLIGLGVAGTEAATADLAAAQPGGPAEGAGFGLAHIDLLDLHLERGPESIRERALLTTPQLGTRYRHASETGARWHRWSLTWDLVERDGFRFTVPDAIRARDHANGLESLLVLQGNPPGVARVDGLPPGTDAPVFRAAEGRLTDEPRGAVAVNEGNPWARYVDAVARRYGPGGSLAAERGWPAEAGVRVWEVGNEPNLEHFWKGSAADFARFLHVARLVLRWHDPGATVLHGGIADDGNAEAWFRRFLAALPGAAGDRPFDGSAWHYYRVPSRALLPPARVRGLLEEAGLGDLPIWVTELGLPVGSEHPGPCWDAASPGRGTTAEQAAFVWQAHAELAAAGVRTSIYFQLSDDCGNGPRSYDAFGLLRNAEGQACWEPPPNAPGCWRPEPSLAGGPRPAYEAYRALVGALAGARPEPGGARLGGPDEGWSGVALRRPDGSRALVAWSRERAPRQISLPARGGRAELLSLDATGLPRRRELRATDGRWVLDLPGGTNRNGPGGSPMVDGRPVLLLEGPPSAAGATGATQGGVAAPEAKTSADPAPTSAPDLTPPYLAVVGVLPERSPARLELGVAAGDTEGRLAQYVVYYAADHPPATTAGWTPIGTISDWPDRPALGELRVPFQGRPGRIYYFAAQAADEAGNWTGLPARPQAWTRIEGGAGDALRPPTRWSTGQAYH